MFLRRFILPLTKSLRSSKAFYFPFATAKKILSPSDIPMKAYAEMTWAITSCHNCKMVADLLKANLGQFSDYQLSFALYQIFNYDLELDDNFYHVIVPIVKELVKNMDRESNRTLSEIISYMGWMKVEDDSLWQLFEEKLLKEKLYRYFSVDQMIDVVSGLSCANKGSPLLYETIEKVFIKHRLALTQDKAEAIKLAFQEKKTGSNLLFKVLENPRAVEMEETEKKAIGQQPQH